MKKIDNIQEPVCSFEVSKLLKEKGFAVLCSWSFLNQNPRAVLFGSNNQFDCYTSVPTHALAIEWVRVNFGWFITVQPINNNEWIFVIYTKNIPNIRNINKVSYNSPQEATEAALLYTLQNLL